jgi:hypothetical protein
MRDIDDVCQVVSTTMHRLNLLRQSKRDILTRRDLCQQKIKVMEDEVLALRREEQALQDSSIDFESRLSWWADKAQE